MTLVQDIYDVTCIGFECLALDCAYEQLRNENVSASVSVNIINTEVKLFSETMINGPHNDCEDEDDIDSGDVVTATLVMISRNQRGV